VSYDHVAWLENLNLVVRVKTGSRDKFGRYRWKRLEMVPIGAFDPKTCENGEKTESGEVRVSLRLSCDNGPGNTQNMRKTT